MNRAGNDYAALVAKSREVGMPRHYLTDLTTHDWAILQAWEPTEFLWIVRPCGTHLYTPEMWSRNEEQRIFAGSALTDAQPWILTNIDYWKNDGARYFVVSDGRMREVSWGEARRFFTDRKQSTN